MKSTMQLVSWATLLTLLVPDLVEMRSPDAAAAVRKDRLHPRQGNVALDPEGPPSHTHTHSVSTSSTHALGRAPHNRGRSPFPRKNHLAFWASPFSGSSLANRREGGTARILGPPPALFCLIFTLSPYSLFQINAT